MLALEPYALPSHFTVNPYTTLMPTNWQWVGHNYSMDYFTEHMHFIITATAIAAAATKAISHRTMTITAIIDWRTTCWS